MTIIGCCTNYLYELPIDIRITSTSGEAVSKLDIIDSFNSSKIFFVDKDFCSNLQSTSASPSPSPTLTSAVIIYSVVAGIIALSL